jgi:dienelactone hydrolase
MAVRFEPFTLDPDPVAQPMDAGPVGDATETSAYALRFSAHLIMLLLLLGQLLQGTASAADPFQEYLNSIPAKTTTINETASGTGSQAITTRRFTFPSRKGANTVFGILARPAQAGPYPGILMLHGGGGNAETMAGYVTSFAQRGYVALAVDLPGICGTDNTPNSTGPWKSRPLGEAPRFEVTPDPGKSTLVDAEVAALEGFNLLESQPDVKAGSLGIMGISWGGYSTTLLSGLLRLRVKAAYAVYGCGFYDKGSFWKSLIAGLPAADRDVWLNTFDAGRRAPAITAAYFLDAASNDTYFWPEAVSATLAAIPASGVKNHVWGPNLNHKTMPSNAAMERLWFDYHLKGQGSLFAKVEIIGSVPVAGAGRKITISAALPAGVALSTVRVHFSATGADWQSRAWDSVTAQAGQQGQYIAALPESLGVRKFDFFAKATDTRTACTSSSMFNTSQTVTAVESPARGGSRPAHSARLKAATPAWSRPEKAGSVEALPLAGPGYSDANGRSVR